ncbi:hypothetical protein [Streptomyces chartreusis]
MVGDRLDAVELRVTLSPAQARAAGIWDVVAGGPPGTRLWFCERRGASPERLPLLEAGAILRLDETMGRPDEAVVVRLRPLRRSRLSASRAVRGLPEGERLDVTAVWRGEQRLLAGQITAGRPAGTVAAARSSPVRPELLFTASQRKFLADCAEQPLDVADLAVFGPVTARCRPAITWSRMPVTVERWTAVSAFGTRLDLVELSRRVGREGAEIAQITLESGLRRRGVELPVYGQGSRTRRALEVITSGA